MLGLFAASVEISDRKLLTALSGNIKLHNSEWFSIVYKRPAVEDAVLTGLVVSSFGGLELGEVTGR